MASAAQHKIVEHTQRTLGSAADWLLQPTVASPCKVLAADATTASILNATGECLRCHDWSGVCRLGVLRSVWMRGASALPHRARYSPDGHSCTLRGLRDPLCRWGTASCTQEALWLRRLEWPPARNVAEVSPLEGWSVRRREGSCTHSSPTHLVASTHARG